MSAPGGTASSRFTAPNQTTEQRLATNVVGLVELSDFRKRRAEAREQQEREAREAVAVTEGATGGGDDTSGKESGDGTEGGATNKNDADGEPAKKKVKKKEKNKTKDAKRKGKVNKLSFGDEEEDEEEEPPIAQPIKPKDIPPIKSFTQQALRRQAAEREALRKEFLQLQAAVKATEVAIPFVFYEGANIPGGVVRVKKGDHVWLMLDRSRKVGARLGEKQEEKEGGGSGGGSSDLTGTQRNQPPRPSKARMHWARINVDDLMLVRGNLIIPHHYDFYYFVINKTVGPGGVRLFNYSDQAPVGGGGGDGGGGNKTTSASASASATATGHAHLEGADDDPTLTKVVDRRWYERNKHIYPASLWQEFDPDADYTQQVRRDQGGNAFFFAAQ